MALATLRLVVPSGAPALVTAMVRPWGCASSPAPHRALKDLYVLGDLWDKATPAERADLASTLFAEVRVRDRAIIEATPGRPEYLPLVASMTVSGAPPDGLRGSETKAVDPLAWYAGG